MVTGKVLEVVQHPSADKLYLLKVDIGEKVIQLVAGLKEFYSQEELIGQSIVVLANLEPKIIRGCLSEGMLLAAQSDGRVSLIIPHRDMKPGSKVR